MTGPASALDSIDIRHHDGANVLLLSLRIGDRLVVRDDPPMVYIVTPTGTPGPNPVPLPILDAVEGMGWVHIDAAGVHLTERGRYQLDRWGRRAFGERKWRVMGREGFWGGATNRADV